MTNLRRSLCALAVLGLATTTVHAESATLLHKQFIAEQQANWKKVRVFDSTVDVLR